MLPVFITSNQIPLHVHAVFCQLHVHCIHLVRGMMRMRIPSGVIPRLFQTDNSFLEVKVTNRGPCMLLFKTYSPNSP